VLPPEERFVREKQKEVSEFKQMLQEKKVGVLNTTWEKELPKLVHDPRFRLVPQQFRRMLYEEYASDH